MPTFNNPKWDYWASVIAAAIELSKTEISEQFQPLIDERAWPVVRMLQSLRNQYDQPVPVELLESIAPSDIAILIMIINDYFGKAVLTYGKESLQLSKEAS